MINFNTKLCQKLISNHRHYWMMIFLCLQYIKDCPPRIRKCSTFAFLFYQDDMISKKAMWESFGTVFHNFADFDKFISQNTNDYNIVICKTKEKDIKKKYKKWKAKSNYNYQNNLITF